MEPFIALALAAAKTGAEGLAGNLVRALTQRESRVERQLAAIEQRLAGLEDRMDKQLEQRHVTAMGVGLRALEDAATTSGNALRQGELVVARDQFREAAASAQTSLQVAVAERLLMLCSFALQQPHAAQNAWSRLNAATTTALAEAAQAYRNRAQLAQERYDQAKRAGGKLPYDILPQKERSVVQDADEKTVLAMRLLRDADAVAGEFGEAAPKLKHNDPAAIWPSTLAFYQRHRWLVEPDGDKPVRAGVFAVHWSKFIATPLPSPSPSRTKSLTRWFRYNGPRSIVEVDVTIHVDPVLSWPTDVVLWVCGAERLPGTEFSAVALQRTLAEGSGECRLHGKFQVRTDVLNARSQCKLIIHSIFVFVPPGIKP
jgi:hypothetical protein